MLREKACGGFSSWHVHNYPHCTAEDGHNFAGTEWISYRESEKIQEQFSHLFVLIPLAERSNCKKMQEVSVPQSKNISRDKVWFSSSYLQSGRKCFPLNFCHTIKCFSVIFSSSFESFSFAHRDCVVAIICNYKFVTE